MANITDKLTLQFCLILITLNYLNNYMWAVAAILKNTAKEKLRAKKILFLIPLGVGCKF